MRNFIIYNFVSYKLKNSFLIYSLMFLRHSKNNLLSDFTRVFFQYLFHSLQNVYHRRACILNKFLILPLLHFSLKQMIFSALKWSFRVIRENCELQIINIIKRKLIKSFFMCTSSHAVSIRTAIGGHCRGHIFENLPIWK